MNLPFFASFIVFGVWLTITLIRVKKKDKKPDAEFWEKEKRANETPAKSLDDLPYLQIPYDTLPFDQDPSDEELADCLKLLRSFSTKKTVNFTGISNTDLKLMYGAANIEKLITYDQNYTLLVRTLQKWATLLQKSGRTQDAKAVLTYAVTTGTDVSATYQMLADILADEGDMDALTRLGETAATLQTPLQGKINASISQAMLRLQGDSRPSSGSSDK